MLHKVFAVFDSAASAFLPPMFFVTKGVAVRSFAAACNQADTQFFKHPQDYTMFELGSWEDSSGKFELHPTPVSVGLAVEFKEVK